MVPTEMLGRYEFTENYIGDRSGSHKFWHIVLDMSTQTYICTWGRIGEHSPDPVTYDAKKAMTKIKEKIKKGYLKVKGYDETTGCQSIHFITKMCEG